MDIDTINKLLEHKVEFVYVITTHWSWDLEGPDVNIEVVRSWEQALEAFQFLRTQEIDEFSSMYDEKDIEQYTDVNELKEWAQFRITAMTDYTMIKISKLEVK